MPVALALLKTVPKPNCKSINSLTSQIELKEGKSIWDTYLKKSVVLTLPSYQDHYGSDMYLCTHVVGSGQTSGERG